MEKGKDYRIKPDSNRVGRDVSQDIVIAGDQTISRYNHAEILYIHDENSFYLVRRESATVKLNNKTVRTEAQLQPFDMIQFGETHFCFVPFCSERFQWEIDT
jgi:hypothetical protein